VRPPGVILEIDGLAKTYAGSRPVEAIGHLTFDVREGELCCVVGPSGCGKTTLLKLLSALLEPTAGAARLHGRAIDEPPPSMALVFQDYSRSLLPWMSVLKNVTLTLRRKRLRRAQQHRLAMNALEAVGLAHAAEMYPWQLSGGMQQRVAIARALAYEPEIFLMDEPFASVDAQTREDLEDLLLGVWSEFGGTIVFVTHDIDEAVYLADRVVALTPAPAHVREIVEIDLPRPRDQVATKDSLEFVQLRSQIYRLVRRPEETAVLAR
jgi:NitT/TauT family transport system ATP-binding protein